MKNTPLYQAFEAEIDGFFMDAHKAEELLTISDFTAFLDNRLNDIIEVHELEEDPEVIYTTFVELYKAEA